MLTAVIPVRAGSTRVKNKNIRPFAGSSLLQVKIRELQRVERIDRIVVSSDSEEMLRVAREEGACAVKRPIEYCDEKTKTFNEVVTHIAREELSGEWMLWAPCVCPLVEAARFREAIEKFEVQCQQNGCDSVVSARLMQEYLFDEKGPVNFSIAHHVPSQRLPHWHVITNGFFLARREDMAKWGFVYGPNPYLLEIDKQEALDIDDLFDFEMTEQAYLARKGKMHE
ncbi:MAG: acylneuraminate cytidylyltransferase family protein [Clostridia bacterium]